MKRSSETSEVNVAPAGESNDDQAARNFRTPWHLAEVFKDERIEIRNRDGFTVAEIRAPGRIEDREREVARRIVACVNACEGLNVVTLELAQRAQLLQSLIERKNRPLD